MRPNDLQPHNDAYLEPVSSRMGRAILEFFRARATGSTFRAEELHQHVSAETGLSAPASADRILRALRQKGVLNYTCISRKYSLYRMDPIERASA